MNQHLKIAKNSAIGIAVCFHANEKTAAVKLTLHEKAYISIRPQLN